ncbi:MAG: N-acetylmuramoyl-L-alanine amidase [Lachnospiraceae bacterium]|nr:N-acetylmuramoyl-L-alanine amidase [Lachnospiraceae bacterium]
MPRFFPKDLRSLLFFSVLSFTTIFLFGLLLYNLVFSDTYDTTTKNASTGTCIVIDPGHGGEDPGKVGINNALEKDINLAIAQKLKSILENKGYMVYLTREDDSVPSSKREDMTERMNLIKEVMPIFTISIHQNSFTDETVCGPQVFYYETSQEGKDFAQIMQNALNTNLSPAKPRNTQANNNYYLLKEAPTPIIIVECGFLSNTSEADLLISDLYQQKVARAIY